MYMYVYVCIHIGLFTLYSMYYSGRLLSKRWLPDYYSWWRVQYRHYTMSVWSWTNFSGEDVCYRCVGPLCVQYLFRQCIVHVYAYAYAYACVYFLCYVCACMCHTHILYVYMLYILTVVGLLCLVWLKKQYGLISWWLVKIAWYSLT